MYETKQNTYTCKNGCCNIKVIEGMCKEKSPMYRKSKKAGVFIYDKTKNKILLVQSKGRFWGLPKGTVEKDESFIHCASRELKEETGLTFNIDNFVDAKSIVIQKKAVYYYIESDVCNVDLQNGFDNDATGITWIDIECLKKCIEDGLLILNRHAKIAIKKFLGMYIGKSEFTTVRR